MTEKCVFCEIIKGNLESSVVYKDDLCTAFLDIEPVNRGHVLIVPNDHVESAVNLDDEVSARMMSVAKKINKALRKSSIHCEGVNYFLADGEAAFQEVFHVHLHCIPRYKNDGFSLSFGEDYFKFPDRGELDKAAEEIKKYVVENE